MDTLYTSGATESPTTGDSSANFSSSSSTDLDLWSMSQSDKPFASTEKYSHGTSNVVAPSALRRRRALSLSSGLHPSGLVASRVNMINMTSPQTKNINFSDPPTLITHTQNVRSYIDRAVPGEEPHHGRDAGRATTFTKVSETRSQWPSFEDKNCNDSDRDAPPSQSQVSSSTSLSRYRPGARMAHVSPTKHSSTADSIARSPASFENEESVYTVRATPKLNMPSITNFIENEGLNNEPLGVGGDSTATTGPFNRGHRRKKTTFSQVKDMVPRGEPQKGAAHSTETFRTDYSSFPGNYPYLDCPSLDRTLNVRNTRRNSLPGYSPLRSTVASSFRDKVDITTQSPKLKPKEKKEYESSRSSSDSDFLDSPVNLGTRNAFYPATFPAWTAASSPTGEPQRPLRRVENFNRTQNFNLQEAFFSQHDLATMIFEMEPSEVRKSYPLEAFVQAGTEDGCAVLDWACPWPPAKPTKKLLRFASRPDFAPSMHYESESEGFADSNASLHNLVDMDESHSDVRKSSRYVVNVPSQRQDDGLTLLAPSTYNPKASDATTVLRPLTYNTTAGDEAMTLLPLTYNAPTSDETESLSSIRRKPIPRMIKDRPLRASAPASIPASELEDDGDNADEDDWTKSLDSMVHDAETESVRSYDSPDDHDIGVEQIRVEKKQKRRASTAVFDHDSRSVGSLVESHPDADVIKEPILVSSINRRPLPSITGVLDYGYQFPPLDQNKRGFSMPIFPSTTTKNGEERKQTRRSSFGKLLHAFGKKDDEPEKVKVKERPKKSIGRRISQSLGRRFSSMWPK